MDAATFARPFLVCVFIVASPWGGGGAGSRVRMRIPGGWNDGDGLIVNEGALVDWMKAQQVSSFKEGVDGGVQI